MTTWKVSSRLLLVLAAIAGVILVWWIISTWWASIWAWWPWSDENRAERAETRADVAEAVAQGETTIRESVERHYTTIREVTEVAAQSETEARSLPDAETPVDPERARVLRDADRGLCMAAPRSCPPAPDAP